MSRILVAGAGYGGLTAAINLAKNGISVTVLEEKQESELGHDWHDSLDIGAFEKSGVRKPSSDKFSFAKQHGYINPSASTAKISFPSKPSTIVMDRKILTSHLCECAKEAGVTFSFSEKICTPLVKDKVVTGIETVKNGKKIFHECDLLIDAAGMYSPVRSKLPSECGIQNKFNESNIFHIFRAYYKNTTGETSTPSYLINLFHMNRAGIDWTSGEKEYVDVLIGKFGVAGKLTEKDVEEALADYRKNYPYISNETLRGGVFADIPLTKMLPMIVCDGYAAVGDSAGMVQPLNGCGIAISMQAGKILADTIIASNGNYNKGSLWKYQYEYFYRFGKTLALLNKIKNLSVLIDSEKIDAFFGSDFVNAAAEKIMNSEKTEFGIRAYVDLFRFLPKLSSLIVPCMKTVTDIPFAIMIAYTMPKKYDSKRVDSWVNFYKKI